MAAAASAPPAVLRGGRKSLPAPAGKPMVALDDAEPSSDIAESAGPQVLMGLLWRVVWALGRSPCPPLPLPGRATVAQL